MAGSNVVKMIYGNVVVTYTEQDEIHSVEPLSVVLPGYPHNSVDSVMLYQDDENENHMLYVFKGK